MKVKKLYNSPVIVEILLDEEISLFLASEGTPSPPPSDQEPLGVSSQGASSFESTNEDDSGIKENPFR